MLIMPCCSSSLFTGCGPHFDLMQRPPPQMENTNMIEPGVYRYPRMERVAFGHPWKDILIEEVERLGARHVFVMASKSLAAAISIPGTLPGLLGGRFAGLATGIRAHTPRGTWSRPPRNRSLRQPDRGYACAAAGT